MNLENIKKYYWILKNKLDKELDRENKTFKSAIELEVSAIGKNTFDDFKKASEYYYTTLIHEYKHSGSIAVSMINDCKYQLSFNGIMDHPEKMKLIAAVNEFRSFRERKLISKNDSRDKVIPINKDEAMLNYMLRLQNEVDKVAFEHYYQEFKNMKGRQILLLEKEGEYFKIKLLMEDYKINPEQCFECD